MDSFQVVLSITADEGSVVDGELEATASVVLAAVQREAAFVALGSVVSVDFESLAIELDCTVCGEGADDVHSKVARIFGVMLGAANSFEYGGSTTHRLEVVPA